MKSILLSIKPQYVAKILNGEKTIEIRKHAIPVGTKVYVYCTKGGNALVKNFVYELFDSYWKTHFRANISLNSKVVASFVVDKRYDIIVDWANISYNKLYKDILEQSCLSKNDMEEYAKGKVVYGLHISQLKIFDRPKELKEFHKWVDCEKLSSKAPKCLACPYSYMESDGLVACARPVIKKAPQSYIFVEDLK